ncbi:MAG: hypothetical protein VKJ24_02960 [Synechococcales bacterium]|nr:hypothetical protein [Synechococcales bacterium]
MSSLDLRQQLHIQIDELSDAQLEQIQGAVAALVQPSRLSVADAAQAVNLDPAPYRWTPTASESPNQSLGINTPSAVTLICITITNA